MLADGPLFLLTVNEVAARLRLRPDTIRDMARGGKLRARKVGRGWRFNAEYIASIASDHAVARDTTIESVPDRVADLALPLYGVSMQHFAAPAFRDPAFTENRAQPIHRWVPWIAGFSAGFVGDCIEQYLPRADPARATILDPFAGVGTTLVEAFQRGFNTVGFEINPYAALAARAKLDAADVHPAELEFWRAGFLGFMRQTDAAGVCPPIGSPREFRSRIPFYSEQVERQVLSALAFIRGMQDQRLRDLFLLAFGAVMVRFSNYSYEPSLASRPGAGKPLIHAADVAAVIGEKLAEMAQDCRQLQSRMRPGYLNVARTLIHASIFTAERHLPPACVDLAITSPPYLNNYHYIRNTRPHLFWLEMVQSTAGLREIEEASFGKFWQTVRDGEEIRLNDPLPDLEAQIEEIRRRNPEKGVYGGAGWANYACQYFNDTARCCRQMSRLLKPGARLVVVIGNSVLQGVELKVDRFLAHIAERHGFETEAIHLLRAKRVGSSIIRSGVRSDAGEKVSLYEVAVVLRRRDVTDIHG